MRHPQADLFICDVTDAVLKDDIASMENPFFALSKKPDLNPRRYESGENWLEVTPSVKGLATIYDKDLLIYCISQIMAKLQKEIPVERKIQINARNFLIFTNRGTGGKDYKHIIDALDRLAGMRIKTNIAIDNADQIEIDGFGLIDSYHILTSQDGAAIIDFTITLSDWVFDAIRKKSILTLHRDYFRLRKPLERRVYEIARKHVGYQNTWAISKKKLKEKCGSRGSMKEFNRMIKELVEGNHLPDYALHIDEENGNVVFFNRGTMKERIEETGLPRIKLDTYDKAREAVPNWDIYHLEQEWHQFWIKQGRAFLKNPDAAFIGFCKNRHNEKPFP